MEKHIRDIYLLLLGIGIHPEAFYILDDETDLWFKGNIIELSDVKNFMNDEIGDNEDE